jgi:hypothetical protein
MFGSRMAVLLHGDREISQPIQVNYLVQANHPPQSKSVVNPISCNINPRPYLSPLLPKKWVLDPFHHDIIMRLTSHPRTQHLLAPTLLLTIFPSLSPYTTYTPLHTAKPTCHTPKPPANQTPRLTNSTRRRPKVRVYLPPCFLASSLSSNTY